jgi:hypothetical protein
MSCNVDKEVLVVIYCPRCGEEKYIKMPSSSCDNLPRCVCGGAMRIVDTSTISTSERIDMLEYTLLKVMQRVDQLERITTNK